MRSQASKPLPKKGALGKTALKAGSAAKQTKKKAVSTKKVKNLVNKSLVKSPKRTSPKDDASSAKNEGDSSSTDKINTSTETVKSGTSKGNVSRSNSPTKKAKKEPKEKKDTVKSSPASPKKTVSKKVIKNAKKTKAAKNDDSDNDDIKYKINLEAAKKVTTKFSKAKTFLKKMNTNQKKKINSSKKQEKGADSLDKIKNKEEAGQAKDAIENRKVTESMKDYKEIQSDNTEESKPESDKPNAEDQFNENLTRSPPILNPPPEIPKAETERPPKFFTSSRSPRMVDIDVKGFKTFKGNLSVSERYLSMKCESKTEDGNNDRNTSNNLVSQGPEIDVYTFTEKVDSPKSILSDFRSPVTKNVGRVRPIARVKGTVIDKKTDLERKKYSPHRPIEEVVKQLKANKRSEELNASNINQDNQSTTSVDSSTISSEKESDDKPKPIVSKSYKMVARKSSITGKPFSPIKFLDQAPSPNKPETITSSTANKKAAGKGKKPRKKTSLSDDDFDECKFSFNTKSLNYSSSDESVSESNDDNDTKESSGSDVPKSKKLKNKKYKRITDSLKKTTSKELKELSKDSLVDIKDESKITGSEKPSKRRLKLLSMWTGPKKHRMASLNAIAKVHCLYENESRTHMELGLMKTVDRPILPSTSKASVAKKKETKTKDEKDTTTTSESEYENKKEKKDSTTSSDSSDDNPPPRTLRGVPGIRSAGKYWDPKSSTSSSEDSELESKKKINSVEKKKTCSKTSSVKAEHEKPPAKMKKTAGAPVKKKRNRNEVVMDLKDMVVQKRMASLNATAILAASYEKRSPKSSKDDTTSDSCSDESFTQKSKNGVSSGVKSEIKHEDTKKEVEETVMTDSKQKVEVIVNQDTDVTITGVYSTHHHEGFCTVSGMQYRISSTSHTQTTATANCEKEGCSRDEARYTPLSALSSMQPPADHAHGHPHPVPELGGLARRAAGCSSAFSAPSPSAHHEPGYYQPAGPMIKESGADAERALARYHPPPPHYHNPHAPMLPQYGPSYYPADLCYGRYYRPTGPYHMPPQPDAQMVGVGNEPYPPPQYYNTPPCYQHSPQRIPYVEYRGCPCPLNACPKNVLIGPATGKAPTGGGPADVVSALATPGGAFLAKVRACALESAADTHGSGKDPPHDSEPPAAADAPHPCPLPAIGGASPKREMFDGRDNIRHVGDIPGPAEALGPPSPARGSAGACAPQPPPVAPRRARLGKDMARQRYAVLADTGQMISAPQLPPQAHNSDADDDVMAISPPICAPIDLSSSDERSTPLVDVKKENEGPTCASSRKADAQALREHNSTSVQETVENTDVTKPVKRRYSRPKLEIDMKDTQLEESCKTNGIGEHVKLQKRRKVSGELTTIPRIETVTKEPKKKTTQNSNKKSPKTPSTEKKGLKRKIENGATTPKAKRMLLESLAEEDPRVADVGAAAEDVNLKPKTKSALLLDNLIRKNSIDSKGYTSDKELNPAELFLPPSDGAQTGSKKTLNINNNVVENKVAVSGVRPNTIAAVTQLIEKKLACKKLEKVDSKITHSLKSVLKTPTDKLKMENPLPSSAKCKMKRESAESDIKFIEINKDKCDLKDNLKDSISVSENKNGILSEDGLKSIKVSKASKPKVSLHKNESKAKLVDESHSTLVNALETAEEKMDPINQEIEDRSSNVDKPDKIKRKLSNKINGQMKNKSIEKVAKLLVSKKPVSSEVNDLKDEEAERSNHLESLVSKIAEKAKTDKVKRKNANGEMKIKSIEKVAKLLQSKKTANAVVAPMEEESVKRPSIEAAIETEQTHPEKTLPKRCKLTNGESKEEKKKKVVKLLVSKKPAIKTDEATLVVEDACASPVPSVGRRTKRRRSGGLRRMRRALAPLVPPALEHRVTPRWSNGWQWDGEHYVSKVYLNNDSRLDRTARCWQRMWHASGDSVARGDCVLLRASAGKQQQPFVARVASLWENPEDGEMMVSLVWYYRPEHTERGREPADAPDEVFASRHRDANSVACIEDKCYVLTFNEYCRYRKRLKAAEEGIAQSVSIVPPLPASEVTPAVAPNDCKLPPQVSPELVLFCRKIYDFRSKKIQVPNK